MNITYTLLILLIRYEYYLYVHLDETGKTMNYLIRTHNNIHTISFSFLLHVFNKQHDKRNIEKLLLYSGCVFFKDLTTNFENNIARHLQFDIVQ